MLSVNRAAQGVLRPLRGVCQWRTPHSRDGTSMRGDYSWSRWEAARKRTHRACPFASCGHEEIGRREDATGNKP